MRFLERTGRYRQAPGDMAARGHGSRRSNGNAQGFYNYCPRDVMLVIGDHIIETPNVIRSRAQETFGYRTMMVDYLKSGAKWYSAPKPMLLDSLFDVDLNKPTPRNDEPVF